VPFRDHPHCSTSLSPSLPRLPVSRGDIRLTIRQKNRHAIRVLVFFCLIVRGELDPQHPHTIILQHDDVMFGVNFHRV
jgi:hypothetical protein